MSPRVPFLVELRRIALLFGAGLKTDAAYDYGSFLETTRRSTRQGWETQQVASVERLTTRETGDSTGDQTVPALSGAARQSDVLSRESRSGVEHTNFCVDDGVIKRVCELVARVPGASPAMESGPE